MQTIVGNFARICPYFADQGKKGTHIVIEVEIQNETHQTQLRLKFMAVPRIGEGIRLREPDGFWASYDVLDVWYQQSDFGKVWVPYLHVRMTPSDSETETVPANDVAQQEFEPFRV